jgi:hypothetical protein
MGLYLKNEIKILTTLVTKGSFLLYVPFRFDSMPLFQSVLSHLKFHPRIDDIDGQWIQMDFFLQKKKDDKM